MIKRFTLLWFAFFTIVVNLKAQTNYLPGFIVTLKGDSLTGLIDSRGYIRNSHICSFKSNEESEAFEYKPGEIKAYGFTNGKYYISKNIFLNQDSITVFLEYLIHGIVNIYAYRDMNGNHFFVEKEGMRITALVKEKKIVEIDGKRILEKNNQYIGILKYTFNESPKIQKKAENLPLNQKSLIKIAKEYNDVVCDGAKCIIYEKKRAKVKFSIEPIVSIDFNYLTRNKNNIDYVYDIDKLTYIIPEEFGILTDKFKLKSTKIDYSIGLIGSLSLPSLNENVALNLQLKYGKYNLMGENELSSGNIGSLTTEGKNLMSNLYFSYTFPKGKFRPIFLAGFSYSHFTTIEDLIIIEHSSVNAITTSDKYILLNDYDADVIDKNYIGLVGGIGLDIPVFKKNKISTIIQYNLMKASDYCYSFSPLSIIIGYKF